MKYLAFATLACAMTIGLFAADSKSSLTGSENSSASSENSPNNSTLFDQPVRIRVNDAPLNTEAKKRFPSPAIFDVDGDGSNDLVIGDLMGGVGVYANLNTSGAGDPVWGLRKALKDSKGESILTPNW